MVESRRLVGALRDALLRHVGANDVEAYVLFRELDYFAQLARDDRVSQRSRPARRARIATMQIAIAEMTTAAVSRVGPLDRFAYPYPARR